MKNQRKQVYKERIIDQENELLYSFGQGGHYYVSRNPFWLIFLFWIETVMSCPDWNHDLLNENLLFLLKKNWFSSWKMQNKCKKKEKEMEKKTRRWNHLARMIWRGRGRRIRWWWVTWSCSCPPLFFVLPFSSACLERSNQEKKGQWEKDTAKEQKWRDSRESRDSGSLVYVGPFE